MEEKPPQNVIRQTTKKSTKKDFVRPQKQKNSIISQANLEQRRNSKFDSNQNNSIFPNFKQFQKNNKNNSSSQDSSSDSNSLDIRKEFMLKKREEIMYLASLTEQLENYELMTIEIRKLIEMDRESLEITLQKNELHFIQNAFQNIVNKRRIAIKAIKKLEYKERQKMPQVLETIKYYRNKIQDELEQICNEVIDIVDFYLDYHQGLKQQQSQEIVYNIIFLTKMKGDYNRYLSELTEEDLQQKVIEEAQEAYQAAWKKITEKENQKEQLKQEVIPKTSTLRIGLGMNYSVFLYEQKNKLQQAYEIAKKTFEDALADKEIQDLEDEGYKDMIQPLQLLRENIRMWQDEINEQGQEDESDN